MPAYVSIKVDTSREPARLSVLNGVPAIYFGNNRNAYLEIVGKTVEEVEIIIAMMNADTYEESDGRH